MSKPGTSDLDTWRDATDREGVPQPHERYILYSYFLLATISLATVFASVVSRRRVTRAYAKLIQKNAIWTKRLETYDRLRQLAFATSAPGDEVFATHDVKGEFWKLRQARQAFDAQMAAVRDAITRNAAGKPQTNLPQDLEEIEAKVQAMNADAGNVFFYFARYEIGKAGEWMASMDRRHRRIDQSFDSLNQHVRRLEELRWQKQGASAARFRKVEYVLALFIVVMIAGTTAYGFALEKQRRLHARERELLITQLQDALANIKTLRGLLPICASCHKIRDDGGYWSQLDTYLREHSEAVLSHGICPNCAERLYPEFSEKMYPGKMQESRS